MQNKIAKSLSNLPIPPEQDCDRDKWSGSRCWKVVISYQINVFLNEDEKDYFLLQLANGKRIVKVGEVVLTNKFLAITKVR